MFTEESRRRLAFVAANSSIDFFMMVTVTYPEHFPSDGVTVKRHLYRLLKWQQRAYGPHNYLWFIEFQARGAPHFHILVDRIFGPAEILERRAELARKWYEIVGSGDERHLAAGTRFERLRSPEGGRRYAVKYAMKMRQKAVPPDYRSVGRFYGYSQAVKPSPVMQDIALNAWELRDLLGDWRYLPDDPEELYKVLFNTSGLVASRMVKEAGTL